MTDRIEIKAALTATAAGEITGTAWPFGTGDRVGDWIEKGAFTGSPTHLPMLWSHDAAEVVGVWESVSETPEGLQVKGRLLVDDIPRAREVRALLQAKAVSGLSIGFITRKSAPRKGGGRNISQLDLAEVSIVAVPSHPGARVTSTKEFQLTELAITNDAIVIPDAVVAQIAALETKAVAFETVTADASKLAARLAAVEVKLNRPGVIETKDEPSAEKKAFGTYLRRGDAGIGDVERKALTVASDASAGYLAPETFGNEIIESIVEYSPIRAFAKVVTIAGPEVKYPRRISGTNAAWVSEIENRPESNLVYGQISITPGELATFVEASKQLIEDSAYDLEAELREAFAEDFGFKEGAAFVSGDGVNKPKGLLSAGTGIPEIVSGAAANLGAAPVDTLIGLYSALPTAYAQNAAWLMNRATLATLRKVKDTSGQYLWQPSVQVGAPSTLLGRPIIEAVDAPNVGAGAFPIVFGDFSGYRIVDRVGVSVLVDPYTRAKNGITVFHARKRVGGDVTNPDRFVKLKISAT